MSLEQHERQSLYPKLLSIPAHVRAQNIMQRRPMLSHEMAVVIMVRKVPRDGILDGQFGGAGVVEGQALWGRHPGNAVLGKPHLLRKLDVHPTERDFRDALCQDRLLCTERYTQ